MNQLYLIVLANLCQIGSMHLFAVDNVKPFLPVVAKFDKVRSLEKTAE